MTARADQPVFRFAPSPNGYLHLGHAYSALLNFELARRTGGRFLLRMEDTDLSRARDEYREAIYEDLSWLGMSWEEPVRQQSEHLADYNHALKALAERGLIYRASLSRSEINAAVAAEKAEGKIWPYDPDGAPHYPLSDRPQSVTSKTFQPWTGLRDYALRLNMDAACQHNQQSLHWQDLTADRPSQSQFVVADPHQWGDVVLVGKDRPATYHLAVVVDDALQGVTHVVRGTDLYHATALHRLLQDLLDLPTPCYCHHDLVKSNDGRKLSKSAQDQSLRALRKRGATPEDIRRLIDFDGEATRQIFRVFAERPEA